MDTSSEYTFPIFISSTDYNLKDFRAELARFLTELGYRPILSSAEGFPDNSPSLEPWESCIPVLDTAFVMILVIDGRYGTSLQWPNSGEIFKGKELSPTHGEYLYAHSHSKRMLVFIRSEVMLYYQSFRKVMKICKDNVAEAQDILNKTLPDHIDFKTLQFLHTVKTSKPIPWIREFNDITSVKKEVQKKMLNELAEVFLIKNRRLEMVVESFNKVMQELSEDQQKEILKKMDVTRPLTEVVDKMGEYQTELKTARLKLEKINENNVAEKKSYEKRISQLQQKISSLEDEVSKSTENQFYFKDGRIQLTDSVYSNTYSSVYSNNNDANVYGMNLVSNTRACSGCGRFPAVSASSLLAYTGYQPLKKCNKCSRSLCSSCWPDSIALTVSPTSKTATVNLCPDCR